MKKPNAKVYIVLSLAALAVALGFFMRGRGPSIDSSANLSEVRDTSKVKCLARNYRYTEKISAFDAQMKRDIDLPEIGFQVSLQDVPTEDGIHAFYVLKADSVSHQALVSFDTMGRMKSIYLPEKLDYGTFRLMISTLSNFHHPGFGQAHLIQAAKNSPLDEGTTDGVMQVAWQQNGTDFVRTGKVYKSLYDEGRTIEIQKSELALSFGPESDFPLAIELEEAMTWHFTQEVSYDGRRSIGIEFIENAEPLIPCEKTSQAALLAQHRLVPYALNWRDQIKEIVSQQKVDVKQELDKIEALIKTTGSAMDPALNSPYALLTYYFRAHPEDLKALTERLKPMRSQELSIFLLDLLGAVGSKEAQGILLPYLNDASDDKLRKRAVYAHMHIKAPEAENVATLREVYQETSAPKETREAALLTMASCAEKLSDDESKPYLDLLKAESKTQEPHQLKLVLAALGNYGKDEAIDALIPFVGAMEEDVSVLALEALAGIQSRRAVDTLLGNVLAPQSRLEERQSALGSIQKSAYQIQNDAAFFEDLLAGYRSIRQNPDQADLARSYLNLLLIRGYNPDKLPPNEVKASLVKTLGGDTGLLPFEKELLIIP